MKCPRMLTVVASMGLFATALNAADDTQILLTTHGVVEKVEKEALTINPRGADGKFEKNLVFKLTGTSRLSLLSTQKRGDKIVLVQKDVEANALAEKQPIAVIYTNNADDHVLLTAVVKAE